MSWRCDIISMESLHKGEALFHAINRAMVNVYSRKLRIPFDLAISKVTESLKKRGFGIITRIDMKTVLKEKINIDFRNYTILGACNPEFAYKAISMESHMGVMLPCNLLVQQHENGEVEISAINPMETIERVLANPSLNEIATEVSTRLRTALDDLHKDLSDTIDVQALPEPVTSPDTGKQAGMERVNPSLELT
jgi:uncharacterized protein (DUF302 family)